LIGLSQGKGGAISSTEKKKPMGQNAGKNREKIKRLNNDWRRKKKESKVMRSKGTVLMEVRGGKGGKS